MTKIIKVRGKTIRNNYIQPSGNEAAQNNMKLNSLSI